MNEKKIAFIYCYNDERLLKESVLYVESLYIPEGYEIEILPVKDAASMAAGYNFAMKQTDAKYKVYLHQDVFIINKMFIKDVLNVFQQDEKVGLLGMVGAKVISIYGNWWRNEWGFGKVYESRNDLLEKVAFNEVENHFEMVQAIDSFLMITQFDITWREDIFDTWCYYNTSQSVEFKRAGYKVAVCLQDEPWCIHDCKNKNLENNDMYRERFINEYSKDIFPLVSVLIPTYNRPEYLQIALNSVLRQTYRNIEIIIADDSTNEETEKIINENYLNKYSNIRYIRNEMNLGQFENDLLLYEMANGEYINYLMDDDLYELTKIEKMMDYFIKDKFEDLSLITSHREKVDEFGNIQGIFGDTDKIFRRDTILNGTDLGNFVLMNNFNCIGEPTTVLFRKSKLVEPFGIFNGRKFGCNVDQATWLNLLTNGNAVFISETLSYFRIHKEQQLSTSKMALLGALDYGYAILTAAQKGFLASNDDMTKALENCLSYCEMIKDKFKNLDKKDFEAEFMELETYYNKLKDKLSEVENTRQNSSNNLPLVSVLIPAYNRPHYLSLALKSVLNQTYSNIEIIICDDSTNEDVQSMIQPYLMKYKQIKYYKNDKNLGAENWNKCIRLANGFYLNFLMDDDLFHPDKIKTMVQYFEENNDISLVTSHRQPIDSEGNKLKDVEATKKIIDKDTIFDGKVLGDFVLENNLNIIGEPTTVLFKKDDLAEPFGYYKGSKYDVINDMATWISLLSKGKVIYIAKTLSYFRMHEGQNQRDMKYIKNVIPQFLRLINDSVKDGFLQNKETYKNALLNHNKNISNIIHQATNNKQLKMLDSNEILNCYSVLLTRLKSIEGIRNY